MVSLGQGASKVCLIHTDQLGNSYVARNKRAVSLTTSSVTAAQYQHISSFSGPFALWPCPKVPELLWREWRQKLRFPAPTLVGFSDRNAPWPPGGLFPAPPLGRYLVRRGAVAFVLKSSTIKEKKVRF